MAIFDGDPLRVAGRIDNVPVSSPVGRPAPLRIDVVGVRGAEGRRTKVESAVAGLHVNSSGLCTWAGK